MKKKLRPTFLFDHQLSICYVMQLFVLTNRPTSLDLSNFIIIYIFCQKVGLNALHVNFFVNCKPL